MKIILFISRILVILILIFSSETNKVFAYNQSKVIKSDTLFNEACRLFSKNEKDTVRIFQLFEKSALNGSQMSANNIGYMMYLSRSKKTEIFDYFLKEANKGNKYVFYNLALLYLHGIGTEENPVKANEYFEKYNSFNFNEVHKELWNTATACLNKIGWMFFFPNDEFSVITFVKEDSPNLVLASKLHDEKEYDKSFKIYTQYAQFNNAKALCNLGYYYWKGLGGLKINKKLAVEYYLESALAGNEVAAFTLATLYQNGIGVSKNTKKSRYFIEIVLKKNPERYEEVWGNDVLKKKISFVCFDGNYSWVRDYIYKNKHYAN